MITKMFHNKIANSIIIFLACFFVNSFLVRLLLCILLVTYWKKPSMLKLFIVFAIYNIAMGLVPIAMFNIVVIIIELCDTSNK